MPHRFFFEAIGTHWVVDIYQDISQEKLKTIETAVRSRIEEFEATYSRFRECSWLMKISKEVGKHELAPDALPLLSLYEEMYKISDGLVTPLIGNVLSDAGYDKEYSFTQIKALEAPPAWDEAIEIDSKSNPATLNIKQPVALDFGAIGKGYIIDIVAMLLKDAGISGYCVDAGGDMAHSIENNESLRVGLEDPQNAKQAIGVITLHNKSIAGSAGNRRRWGMFNHIINPKTLMSSEDILAIWVVADTTMRADALTTGLYFVPAETLIKKFSFDYLIMYSDRSVEGTLIGNPMLELF